MGILLMMSGYASAFERAWFVEFVLRQPAEAGAIYERLLDSPDRELAARAHLRLGACYEKIGRSDSANKVYLKLYTQFRDIAPEVPYQREKFRIIDSLLDQAYKRGEKVDARELFAEILHSISLATANAICDSYFDRAEKNRLEKPSSAISDLKKAVALSQYLGQSPRAAYAKKTIGDILAERGLHEQAIEIYRSLQQEFRREKEPCAWAQMSIAEIRRIQGRFNESEQVYRELLERYSSQTTQVLWARLWLGDLLRAEGKLEEARAEWERVARMEGTAPAKLASALLGRTPPKLPVSSESLLNDSAYFVAYAYRLSGKKEEWRMWLQRSLQFSRERKLAPGDWPQTLVKSILEGRDER